MYECIGCGAFFEFPHYEMMRNGEHFGSPYYEPVASCPRCFSSNYERIPQSREYLEMIGEYIYDEDI